MGMSTTVGEFAGKLEKVGTTIDKEKRAIINDAALAGKTIILTSVKDVVPDLRMSGVGRGAKVGVRYDIKGTGNPTALLKANGPLHLVERDTAPHVIPKTRRSRRRRKVLLVPGVGHRRAVQHPGTRGQHPWEKGVDKATPVMTRIVGQQVIRTIGKVL